MKYTKGNWIVANSGGTVTTQIDFKMKTICVLETVPLKITEEVYANACLLATAPELCECCIAVLNDWHSKTTNMNRKEPKYLERIRIALKKVGYWDE